MTRLLLAFCVGAALTYAWDGWRTRGLELDVAKLTGAVEMLGEVCR